MAGPSGPPNPVGWQPGAAISGMVVARTVTLRRTGVRFPPAPQGRVRTFCVNVFAVSERQRFWRCLFRFSAGCVASPQGLFPRLSSHFRRPTPPAGDGTGLPTCRYLNRHHSGEELGRKIEGVYHRRNYPDDQASSPSSRYTSIRTALLYQGSRNKFCGSKPSSSTVRLQYLPASIHV